MDNCDYGCGQKAKYKFQNGKMCCSKHHNSCPAIKNKNREKHLGENNYFYGKKRPNHSKRMMGDKNPSKRNDVRRQLREQKLGEKNPNFGISPSEETRLKMRIAHQGEKSSLWKGGYGSINIPRYDHYKKEISFIDKCRRNKIDNNILEVKCTYCGKWFIPKLTDVNERTRCVKNGIDNCRLYCSKECKQECPIYNQRKFPKGFKPSTSREVQPELRQIRFKIDNYTCQKCGVHKDELNCGLHCHHLEGIKWDPLESTDFDRVITVCKYCHNEIHKKEGCGYNDLKCKNGGHE